MSIFMFNPADFNIFFSLFYIRRSSWEVCLYQYDKTNDGTLKSLKLRPIIAQIGTFVYNTAQFMAKHLKPLYDECSYIFKLLLLVNKKCTFKGNWNTIIISGEGIKTSDTSDISPLTSVTMVTVTQTATWNDTCRLSGSWALILSAHITQTRKTLWTVKGSFITITSLCAVLIHIVLIYIHIFID